MEIPSLFIKSERLPRQLAIVKLNPAQQPVPPETIKARFNAGTGYFSDGTQQKIIEQTQGAKYIFPEAPIPYEGYEFDYWFDVETGEHLDRDSIVTYGPEHGLIEIDAYYKLIPVPPVMHMVTFDPANGQPS